MLTLQTHNKAFAGTEEALLPPSAFAEAWQKAGCLLNSPGLPSRLTCTFFNLLAPELFFFNFSTLCI